MTSSICPLLVKSLNKELSLHTNKEMWIYFKKKQIYSDSGGINFKVKTENSASC